MIFKILQIRSSLKEAQENPGKFASSQTRDALIGILIMPMLILIVGLVFLFALGFTHFLGGPYFFFKLIFFIGLLVSVVIGSVVYKLVSILGRATKKVVNKTASRIVDVPFEEKN